MRKAVERDDAVAAVPRQTCVTSSTTTSMARLRRQPRISSLCRHGRAARRSAQARLSRIALPIFSASAITPSPSVKRANMPSR